MGRGKKGRSARKSCVDGDYRALRNHVEGTVNEAVKIQDSAASLPDYQASTALKLANEKYREALKLLPGHAEAAYNLATCLSEQADLLSTYDNQITLRVESRALLEGVIERDTSGRGATTALAHHATGNVIRDLVEAYRERCYLHYAAVETFSVEEWMEELRKACRHFDASVSINKQLQNPSGHMDEVLAHHGDAFASMMQVIMEIDKGHKGTSIQMLPPSSMLQEAFTLCSNACAKYSEALAAETSSRGSDVDILRLKAGAVVEFLDWALLEDPSPGPVDLGFPAGALLTTGEQAAGTLLGLEGDHTGGLLAKGDLCRLRARMAMLSSANLEEERRWREESVQWFARAVAVASQEFETLSTAAEGSLEYGKRSFHLYEKLLKADQKGDTLSGSQSPLDVEGLRKSAIIHLQDAGNLFSRAASVDTHDTDVAYNAACAFALLGDHSSCSKALDEFCRRLTADASSLVTDRREFARKFLLEVEIDRDLEGVKATEWFAALIRRTEAALLGG